MVCPKCGKELPDNAAFCGQCGTALRKNETPEKKGGSKNVLIISLAFAAVVCVILAVAAIFILKGNIPGDNPEIDIADANDEELRTENDSERDTDAEYPSENENEAARPDEDRDENLLPGMSAEEKRSLNVFLSNFSEAHLYEYGNGNPDEDVWLISFAFVHNMINGSGDKIKDLYDEENIFYKEGISAEDVDATLEKYFGRTVPHKDTDDEYHAWTFKDGAFWCDPADGENYYYFSVAEKMTDNHDGTYTVKFKNFYDPREDDAALGECYSYSVEEAESRCEFCQNGTAIVRKKVYNGKNTYELVECYVE